MLEKLLKSTGFLYQIGGKYYFLGKWICKECTDENATDCVMMHSMSMDAGEIPEATVYFNKIRAYADFALEVPYNPIQIKEDMTKILDGLSEAQMRSLEKQFDDFSKHF